MDQHVFVARQPIVSSSGEIYGYELLFRDNDQVNKTIKDLSFDDTFATANVVSTVMNQFGLEQVVGTAPAFINIDKDFIYDDLLLSIPKELFVFEILEDVEVTEKLAARLADLNGKGYRFALDDIELNEDFFGTYGSLFKYIEFFKIDLLLTPSKNLDIWIPRLKKMQVKILAEKVEDADDVWKCSNLKVDLFQGYYFAKPKLMKHPSINPESQIVLDIIASIDHNASVDNIVTAFSKHAEMSIQLIRFINSAHTALKSPIQSIHHAIMLIGLKPLREWLLLMAFSQAMGHVDPTTNPLFVIAKTRSNFMRKAMEVLNRPKEEQFTASFIGLLSLLDALFQVSMEYLLTELNVTDLIIQAILHHNNINGQLLELCIAVEQFDTQRFAPLCQAIGLPRLRFESIVLESYQ